MLGLQTFIEYMNETAQALLLQDSSFAVSHGMHHDNNYSTALDMGRLSLMVL